MPTYEITTDRGKFRITAPDEESATEAMNQEMRALERADQLESVLGKSGAGELFGNQFVFGLKDKVAGLAGGVDNLVKGKPFGEGFETGRRAQEIIEQRARDRTGKLGTAAEFAGAVGTGALAKAPAAATWLGRIGQGAKEAGYYGLGFGAGESEARSVPEFIGDVATSGATSAALGGALGTAIEGGRAAVRGGRMAIRALGGAIDDPVGTAGRKVAGSLADDAMTPEGAAARMKTRDTALVNVGGENTTGLARSTSARPGPGRRTMDRALDAQQKGSFDKATRAVNEALGGADQTYNRRVVDMIAKRGKAAQDIYGKAFVRNFGDTHAMVFDDLAKRVPGEAVKNAMRIAKAEGRPFGQQLVASIDDAGNVAFSRQPSLQEWHYIQRGLRSAKDAAYRSGVGEVGTAYGNLHKQILAAMDEASPLYKMARQNYANESQMIDALQMGRDVLKPATTRNVDTLVDDLAAMSKPEREMVRVGLARGLEDMIQSTPDKAGDVVKKIFGTPAKRNAIRAAFENATEFRKFEVAMKRLAKEGDVFRAVRTGSRTSFVDAEKQGFGAMADVAHTMAEGGIVGGGNATLRAAAKLIKSMGQMDDTTAAEVAKILVERDPNVVLRALAPSTKRAAGQAARDEFFRKASALVRAANVGGSGRGGQELSEAMFAP